MRGGLEKTHTWVRSPQEVVEHLDGAFAALVKILDRHGGIVNTFLGDGFLTLFGAPIVDPRAAGPAAMRIARRGRDQGI
jgi:adenylate cyclase